MSKRLEEKLGKELYDQVLAKGIKATEIDLLDGFIPRGRYNEVSDKSTALQAKVESYEKQINETQAMLKGNDELKGQYNQLQDKYKSDLANKDKEIVNIYKKSMMKEALVKEGAKHVDLLMHQVNFDTISIDNGNLIGGTEIVGKLKTDFSDLFTVAKVEGTPSGAGNTGTNNTGSSGKKDWGAVVDSLTGTNNK